MDCPMDNNTWSQGTVNNSSSSYFGENRLFSSRTEIHFLNTTAVTLPFSVRISFGPQELFTTMPSSSASVTSSSAAGIISLDSRQNMDTSEDPVRSAVLATSTATFPPPITTVLPDNFTPSSFKLTRRKKSTPVSTPTASSPGTPVIRPPCAPIAM